MISALAAVAVLIPLTACTGNSEGPDPVAENTADTPAGTPAGPAAEVGEPLLIDVDPDTTFDVAVPDVGRLTAPPQTFTTAGQVTITPDVADVADLDLTGAGKGVDVAFAGTSLNGPLTLEFETSPASSADALPVVAHRSDDGSWDVLPAEATAQGHIAVSTQDFSLVVPAWANPASWWQAFTDRLAGVAGGRTDPLTCSGAPSWFHLDERHSDLVHTCATSNTLDDGTEVAEVQLKSNRGVSVEVTVPGDPAYVWVEGAPWGFRQWVASKVNYDPNHTVILPAGVTMTVGYRQGHTDLPFSFFVSGATGWAFTDTVTRALLNFILGELSEKTTLTFLAVVAAKCVAGVEGGLSGAQFGPRDFIGFVGCLTGEVADELRDEGTAIRIGSEIGQQPDGREVAANAKKLGAFGWLVTLWPAFQAGWGNVIDKVRELGSDGDTARVTYWMDPIGGSGGSGGLEGLATAQVPSLCDHPAGQLVGGSLPIDDPSAGFVTLTLEDGGPAPGPLLTDITGDGQDDAVVVATCSTGGVSWPMYLLAYGPDLELLGAADLEPESDDEHADVTGTAAAGTDVMVTWVGYDGAGDNPLTFGSRLHYDGTQLQLLDTFAVD